MFSTTQNVFGLVTNQALLNSLLQHEILIILSIYLSLLSLRQSNYICLLPLSSICNMYILLSLVMYQIIY
jgi:hypothetical protein